MEDEQQKEIEHVINTIIEMKKNAKKAELLEFIEKLKELIKTFT